MIVNYGYFGDAVTFYMIYSANRDERPLAFLLGLNHDRETTIFGIALLYDDTIASFEWLFEAFIKVLHGKKPVIILLIKTRLWLLQFQR